VHQRDRIDRAIVPPHLEVQVRTGGRPGAADRANPLAVRDPQPVRSDGSNADRCA